MEQIKRAVAIGFFDGVHFGHAALLEKTKQRAQESGAIPSVVSFDVHPDNLVFGGEVSRETYRSIIWWTRLPRVLCAGLMGAALSLCGAAMQGLLRNPLADGSTLGVSSGAGVGVTLPSVGAGVAVGALTTVTTSLRR